MLGPSTTAACKRPCPSRVCLELQLKALPICDRRLLVSNGHRTFSRRAGLSRQGLDVTTEPCILAAYAVFKLCVDVFERRTRRVLRDPRSAVIRITSLPGAVGFMHRSPHRESLEEHAAGFAAEV